MSTLTFTMALLMGFTGSLHCAGMCGPIQLVLPFQAFSGMRKAAALALYHLGRISVYALLAVVLHSFRGLFNPHVQQYISIIMGVLLLIVGITTFLPGTTVRFNLPWAGYVKKQIGQVIGKPGFAAIGISGVLNGLLPCGLVYMALSATITANSALSAAGLMYVFGLGTVPMLVSIAVLKSRISFLRTGQMKKLVPAIMFVFGCLFVLRGMNLGVPYLSPKVEVEKHEIRSCCSKHKNRQ